MVVTNKKNQFLEIHKITMKQNQKQGKLHKQYKDLDTEQYTQIISGSLKRSWKKIKNSSIKVKM